MANPEHLDLLKQGVETWNAWRAENEGVQVDLSGAHLRGANLTEANLRKANLHRADLRGTDLRGTDLRGTDLYRAKLRGAVLYRADLQDANLQLAILQLANLRGADLQEADLRGADLRGADLYRANLREADLYRANLQQANLQQANLQLAILREADLREAILSQAGLGETSFADTNLTDAQGLGRCRHKGPSTIDHRTLAQNPHLPIEFLKGCGLSDADIEYAKLYRKDLSDHQITDIGYRIIELRSDPAIQFHSCFISYSSKNDDFARRLHDGLQDKGVRCWFAPEDLKIGDEFRNVIEDAVRLHDKVLLILSKASVKSEWVKDEVEAALEKERRRKETVLFPIQIDDTIQRTRQPWAAKLRRQRHIGDFTHWKDHDQYNESFNRLLRDLKA